MLGSNNVSEFNVNSNIVSEFILNPDNVSALFVNSSNVSEFNLHSTNVSELCVLLFCVKVSTLVLLRKSVHLSFCIRPHEYLILKNPYIIY